MNLPVADLLQSIALVIAILSVWAYNRARLAVLEEKTRALERQIRELTEQAGEHETDLAILRDRQQRRPPRS